MMCMVNMSNGSRLFEINVLQCSKMLDFLKTRHRSSFTLSQSTRCLLFSIKKMCINNLSNCRYQNRQEKCANLRIYIMAK
uniref:Uncharacterized protein n=1 Tax=Pyxicephalus adspersus TaxID=30357 RepID=A0AAV3AVK9_PYXAD|nr:TPA: hypothetical protein GDO54_009341 [Pyxicephalus adspersus]